MPAPSAADWHCKYSISADRLLVVDPREEYRGYIFLDIEPYAFDEDVFVIVQPHGEFYDHNRCDPQHQDTGVFAATFGRRFYIPAER